MNALWIFFFSIGVPILMLVWHVWKTDGKRPDGYKDIHDRPVIPAVILDVNMPFSSMVVFMFKLALASLPAIILLMIVLGGITALTGMAILTPRF
jgi:hypothetical protein